MPRAHQPGQAVFRSILPEDIDWKPFPAFPPEARLATLVGHPSEPGPYVIRVKVPSGTKLMPHRHPEDRIYTVMSGVFYIGLGDRFDGDKVQAFPPGSVIVLPGRYFSFPLGRKPANTSRKSRRSARWASNIWIPPTIHAGNREDRRRATVDSSGRARADKVFEARNPATRVASAPNQKSDIGECGQKTGTGLARPRSLPQ